MSFTNRFSTWMKRATGLLMVLAGLVPATAMAAEADVVLKYSRMDQIFLGVSLLFGIIAILAGAIIASAIKKMSPGNDKMQEVGAAIKAGALAYLKKQVVTMAFFVAGLAAVLVFVYGNQYGAISKGLWTALSFVLGVAASYIAGYTGMLLAVEGNMRTANAALTSFSRALQVAFRSGAVAGLITVGMGLIGATAILFLGGSDAMKYLVGFGFGGSLAALFMRVGGGIFTKAADVGADLVGKVEAGIPEDDPRNPAVIADNVGDNVGDCAGMAADVFESYEVTLVAAIVLGAATSAIFDQPTWMKLVMFALLARGVGIIASIVGILLVKGSDDLNSDPLKSIRKGFQISALAATLGTAVLAFFLMGDRSPVLATQFVSQEAANRKEVDKILAVRDAVLSEKKIGEGQEWRVTVDEIKARAEFKALGIAEELQNSKISQALASAAMPSADPKEYRGFSPVDFKGDNPILGYTVMSTPAQPTGEQPKPKTFREEYSVDGKGEQLKPYVVVKLNVAPKPSSGADPAQMKPRDIFFGPTIEADLDKQIEAAQSFATVTKLERFAVKLYASPSGDAVWGIDKIGEKGGTLDAIQNLTGASPIFYYKVDPATYEKIQADQIAASAEATKDPTKPARIVAQPPTSQIDTALAVHKEVEWWRFFLAIFFGIAMAFAIEYLTDYYVGLHKKPVQEVAGVATAGPAPMIINGFALAQESSVFSVFVIVVSLLVPLYIFPPEAYGSFILSFYGISLVGLGLLTTTGFILAMDTFGPISDNAQGVFEMSGAGHGNAEGARRVQLLDAAGNTTKALTKGFAIATAVVAAVALFHSFIEEAKLTGIGLPLDMPKIFLGLLVGGAAPYLFSAFSINAVGRSAFDLINEVRTQFRNDPGIMKGTSKPNYANCVAIVTAAAQKELLGPGILAIALPIAVAFGFAIGEAPVRIGNGLYNLAGAQALGGFLAGAILSGQLMAVLLANAGGIWDNAKKLIEDGLHGGKGTDAHKAGVVCDTVGDPFKDTAGPALNPLIKVMNLVALLLAPIVIQPVGVGVQVAVTVVCLAALAFSIFWSKRSSMSSQMSAAATPEGPSLPPAGGRKKASQPALAEQASEDVIDAEIVDEDATMADESALEKPKRITVDDDQTQ